VTGRLDTPGTARSRSRRLPEVTATTCSSRPFSVTLSFIYDVTGDEAAAFRSLTELRSKDTPAAEPAR